MKMSEIRG